MGKRTTFDRLFDAANYVLMTIVGIFMFFPFLYIASYSLSESSKLPQGLLMFPAGFTLEAYARAFEDPAIFHSILISVGRTLLGPVVMIFVSSMASYCLTRDDFIAVRFWRKFFVFTMYFTSGLIPLYVLIVQLNLSKSFWVYIVNNAGIAVRESFASIPLDRWRKILDVNLNGTFILSQNICKRMIEAGIQGTVVNMASKNGLAGSSMLAHYNASKGGVLLLTKSMAVDLAPYGIRVNAVAPGFIDTPLDRKLKENEAERLVLTERTPMRRLGTVEETANAFLFLASDEASYITGTTLVVDGGHLANASDL